MKWIFHVYDVNQDGVLSNAEIREVTAAVWKYIIFLGSPDQHFQVYDLMGSPTGERQKSEAVDLIINSRADTAFKVGMSGLLTH